MVLALSGGLGTGGASAATSPAFGKPLIGAATGWEGSDNHWLRGDYVDYSPVGMPDFSQCRTGWGQVGDPGQWTYAGPVALANALWWLDSVAEPAPRPPPAIHDGHALVTAYPVFGPAHDDHSVANLVPLVDDLALRAATDGLGQTRLERGTRWESFTSATQRYIADRRLTEAYAVVTATEPGLTWIADRVAEGAGVVLLTGVWEAQEVGWRRVGGHYVTLAGADREAGWLGLSDPLADSAGSGGAGRARPSDPRQHNCRGAPRAHDDAGTVSHDLYMVTDQTELPGGRVVLSGYFTPSTYHEAAAFAGQNPARLLDTHSAAWRSGPVVMALDAALAIVPMNRATPTPTASATPTATARATATPEASPTALPTVSALVSPTPPPLHVSTAAPAPLPERRWPLFLPLTLRRW